MLNTLKDLLVKNINDYGLNFSVTGIIEKLFQGRGGAPGSLAEKENKV